MKIRQLLSLNAITWVVLVGTLFIVTQGCITESKVKRWNDKHPEAYAKGCADAFPVIAKIDSVVTVDSSAYIQAYIDLMIYADSLLNEMQKHSTDTLYVPSIKADAKLREQIEKEVRRRLKPCVDSVKVITITVPDSARVKELMLKNSRIKDSLMVRDLKIVTMSDEITQFNKDKKSIKIVFGWLLLAIASKWWFWVVVFLFIVYVTRGIWIRFLPPGISTALSFLFK